jgi:hypothetical protein
MALLWPFARPKSHSRGRARTVGFSDNRFFGGAIFMRRRLSTWLLIATMASVLALAWITTVLAETDGDTDGFDGDELGLPIVLGVAVLTFVGWMAFRSRSHKSS